MANPGLRTAEVDGSGERQLTPPDLTAPKRTLCRGIYAGEWDEYGSATSDPEWSPDGSRVAFARDEPCSFPLYGRRSIWTIKADGTELRRLTPAPAAVTDETASYESPTWSPDGKRIAYVERPDTWHHAGDIYVMSADGSDRRRLTRRGDAQAPAWSPDGGRIAFQGWDPPEGGESDPLPKTDVFVLDLRDGAVRRLTATGSAGPPDWSPDGRQIAYASGGVVVVNAEGSNKRKLLRRNAGACPVWSADGKQIAFRRDGQNEWGIYVVAADGNGEPRHVARTEDCSFDWGVRR